MKIRSLSSLAVLGLAVLLSATGCLSVVQPENEVTWAVKAAMGNLTATTVTEWQAVAETIDEAVPEVEVLLTDAQAQAILDFIRLNEIDTLADIQAIIEQALSDPASIQLPDGFLELFSSFSESDFDQLLTLLGQ